MSSKMHKAADTPSFPLFSGIQNYNDDDAYGRNDPAQALMPTGDAHQAVNNILTMFNMF